MRTLGLALFPLLGACQEYQFTGQPEIEPAPAVGDFHDESRTDILAQRDPVDQADILWVIDDSCSMEDDQERLTSQFPSFMNFFLGLSGDVDYHIGVVSTDIVDPNATGKLREVEGYRWIDTSIVDPIPMFELMARLGTAGSGDESGRGGAYHALTTEKDAWNAGFLRDDSLVSVIVISDEDDSSDLFGVSSQMFYDALGNLRYEPGLYNYNTIVGPTPDGCDTAVAGSVYETDRAAIGGISYSICDENWDRLLEELALQAAGMKRDFYLTEQPIPDTLAVRSVEPDGTETEWTQDVDYTYDAVRNGITFIQYLPPPYTTIYVDYQVDVGAEH